MAVSIAEGIADVALGVNVRERTSFYLLYRRHINKEIPDEINRRGLGVFIRRTFPKPSYQLLLYGSSKNCRE